MKLAEEPENVTINIFKPDFAAYSQRILMQATTSQSVMSGAYIPPLSIDGLTSNLNGSDFPFDRVPMIKPESTLPPLLP